MICSHHEPFAANRLSGPRMSGSAAKGNITSVIRPTSGPKNPGGITPTMVNGMRCTVSWRPTTSLAPAKRCRQRRWLMTATGPSGAAPPSSAGVSIRPRMAGDAEHVEEPAADVRAVHGFGLTAGRQVEPLGGPRERAVEQLGLACPDLVPDRIGP